MTVNTHISSKITIGITCFNAEKTIQHALSSAINQQWDNKEIIVIDDCSTDNSLSVIKNFCQIYTDIIVIKHSVNKGYPSALNTIIDRASGEFVAFFDDDDTSRKDRLTLQWERIVQYEQMKRTSLILCYSNRNVVKQNEIAPTFKTLAIGRQEPEPYGEMVSDYLLALIKLPPYVWGQFGSCTLMARTHVLKDLKGFDENFRRSAEWDLAIRAAFDGFHFIAVNKSLITQYLTTGNASEKSGKTPLKYALKLRKKHKSYLLRKNIYLASIAQAYARFHYSRMEIWQHRLFTLFACLLAPTTILSYVIRQRK